MDIDEFDRRLTAAITAFPAELRPRLLRVLDLPDDERAAEIGELFQDGRLGSMAELLIDLTEEPVLRKLVAAQLREMIHREAGG